MGNEQERSKVEKAKSPQKKTKAARPVEPGKVPDAAKIVEVETSLAEKAETAKPKAPEDKVENMTDDDSLATRNTKEEKAERQTTSAG